MATCDLTLVLEQTDRVYRPGETISGRVDIQTDGSVSVDALTVELSWATHGKGNRVAGTAETVTVYQGDLDGLSLRSFPFAITCPPGPFTYHGELLNVDWDVRARADIPWKIDPKVDERVTVLPPERSAFSEVEAGEGSVGPRAPQVLAGIGGPVALPGMEEAGELTDEHREQIAKASQIMGKVGKVALGCFLIPFLLAGLGSLTIGIFALLGHFQDGGAWTDLSKDELVPLVVGLVFVGITGLFLVGLLKSWVASRRLGEVTLEIPEPVLLAGQTVEWRLAFQPPKQLDLDGVRARVVCRERVTRGSGTNRRTYTHDLVTHEIDLAPARQLFAGQPFEVRGSFPLPVDAPFSFRARDNSLEWAVECTVDIPKWPDWTSRAPFVVVG